MDRDRNSLIRRIRLVTGFFMVCLVLSGATAIPLNAEMDWLVNATGARQFADSPGSTNPPDWAIWLTQVQDSLHSVARTHPFLFYGTDWLAFGHFAIAIAFGQIACVLVIPYTLVFGGIRGIPIWWRWIDCSYGVFGLIPLTLCRFWLMQLNQVGSRSYSSTSL
jgi:hypothetical protein